MREPTDPGSGPEEWGPAPAVAAAPTAERLLAAVAKGDDGAFDRLYDLVAGPVLGVIRQILRDAAQSEEVAQEVLVEVWRTATKYREERGRAMTWVLTLAHRRAVDRVRSAQASSDRETRAYSRDTGRPFDEVAETVASRMEQQQVRRCMSTLTELQRESVVLTYYRGYSCREAAELLDAPVPTVKTRLRDGLIRLRDCLGVGS
ncbi:ECF RNA polymerase sigma factor SigK [Amycolatopsis cihanbeyliensis]|uniref:RNA polymerase sigma-70 factor (ECF subfamily) n=1 Tax=Amycolatopsis cihanbeyliensis TaxID=1128664 RepID=A0A542DHV2_AMYCI|nr:ECF RNA polymerase sigma factor SigK [Amycolatopsis cihanbeyliensis]TQJ02663.1 RNA polymerase sigma-70 factor (ECF subfamily) [Amycolatopsis cihanbeyliensis]